MHFARVVTVLGCVYPVHMQEKRSYWAQRFPDSGRSRATCISMTSITWFFWFFFKLTPYFFYLIKFILKGSSTLPFKKNKSNLPEIECGIYSIM